MSDGGPDAHTAGFAFAMAHSSPLGSMTDFPAPRAARSGSTDSDTSGAEDMQRSPFPVAFVLLNRGGRQVVWITDPEGLKAVQFQLAAEELTATAL